eukprot:CAMPEP_0201112090 /NCGR_PEP_ID=MMETSP0812-20130820/77027_1 /ASSEMBLY_ACC=CAM_ASM_000668 /TAXON_ID=98059 /ORGANISM="Dinobryon sp., Strain UTEXLB2267" /LENGTH=182 /DNA_ID=CAMNT_0047375335 /DNA_START=410 /DNA_END=957 /DNA_ORIENTATION=-
MYITAIGKMVDEIALVNIILQTLLYNGWWKEMTKVKLIFSHAYKGTWLNNKKHGKGLIYSNGDIYSGDWKNDLCHGSCILTFASESDDSSYCGGGWAAGFMERDASWPGGSEYDGDWQCDRREGFGRQKDDDGGVYEGAQGHPTWRQRHLHYPGWQATSRPMEVTATQMMLYHAIDHSTINN